MDPGTELKRRSVILLDLDGVMICTPHWHPDRMHADGYSDFEPHAVENLNALLSARGGELWLSSTRRSAKSLSEFRQIFRNRGIQTELAGLLPVYEFRKRRREEIDRYLDKEQPDQFLILDDDAGLADLSPYRKRFWVRTAPMRGFTADRLELALHVTEGWET